MPITVLETASIYDATVTMFTQNVGSLSVVDEEWVLLGMLSRKDVLKASLGKMDIQQVPVGVIMTRMPNIYMIIQDEPVFGGKDVKTRIRRVPYVRDEAHLEDIIEEAHTEQAILVYTLVLKDLRDSLEKKAIERGLIAVDILGPLIGAITCQTGLELRHTPNIIHRLDEQYFRKVEAIEFAVKYEDGRIPGMFFMPMLFSLVFLGHLKPHSVCT